PQGGVISPILGNVYLHYALDLWFEKVVKKNCKGEAHIVRYCDDFVCCFEYENEAKSFYEELKKRLAKFNLQIAEDKTKILHFGKTAYYKEKFGKSDRKIGETRTFDFLGFTHYCSCSIKGSLELKGNNPYLHSGVNCFCFTP
ncbi:MAG TPA: reverse transcriptase domain-containing protein, partial [Clostridiaceae bacterium]